MVGYYDIRIISGFLSLGIGKVRRERVEKYSTVDYLLFCFRVILCCR